MLARRGEMALHISDAQIAAEPGTVINELAQPRPTDRGPAHDSPGRDEMHGSVTRGYPMMALATFMYPAGIELAWA